MLTKRISTVAIVLAVAAVAIVTASFTSRPPAAKSLDDFALRHPLGLSQPSAAAGYYRGSDYAERHPASSIDTSDYALRHASLMVTVDTSDYALRHAELPTASVVVDSSDYALRHPEFFGR